jgi:hypothetical protein
MLNFDWFGTIDVNIARYFVIIVFAGPALLALGMRGEYIYRGAPAKNLLFNLRLWVCILAVIMILIYSYF